MIAYGSTSNTPSVPGASSSTQLHKAYLDCGDTPGYPIWVLIFGLPGRVVGNTSRIIPSDGWVVICFTHRWVSSAIHVIHISHMTPYKSIQISKCYADF